MVLTQSQIHIGGALSQECLRGWSIDHLHDWQLGAGCWRGASVPLHPGGYLRLLEYLHMVAAGLQSEQFKSQGRQDRAIYWKSHTDF